MLRSSLERVENEDFESWASEVLDSVYLQGYKPGIFHDDTPHRDKIWMIDGEQRIVEEKHRRQVRDDMLVELVQDVTTVAPGWLHYIANSETQIIYSMFKGEYGPLDSVYMVSLRGLRKYVQNPENWPDIRWLPVSTKGQGVTFNCAIPWEILLRLGYAQKLDYFESLVEYPPRPGIHR